MTISARGYRAVRRLVSRNCIPGGLSVQRAGPPTVDRFGERVEADRVPTPIDPIAIHEATPSDARYATEGQRSTGVVRWYTYDTPTLQRGGPAGPPDEFTWRGTEYVVLGVSDYAESGGANTGFAQEKATISE